jgi:hypothetical protein
MGTIMECVNEGTPFSLIGPLQIQGGKRRALASHTGTLRVRSRTSARASGGQMRGPRDVRAAAWRDNHGAIRSGCGISLLTPSHSLLELLVAPASLPRGNDDGAGVLFC